MIQSVAPAIGIDVRPISVHGDIESVVAKFARVPNGGLVATAVRRLRPHSPRLITTLAARHKLPAISPFKFFVTAGGLMSYGADFVDQFVARLVTWIAFSKAKSLPTCRCRRRTNMSW